MATVESCHVYRLLDDSHWQYFVICPPNTPQSSAISAKACGKGCRKQTIITTVARNEVLR